MADQIIERQQTFQKQMENLKKQLKQVSIPCPHQYEDKHKQAIKPVEGTMNVKCKRCSEEFSVKKVTNQELVAAVSTIHNAINQIKLCCDPNSEEDMKLVENLGKQDFYNLDLIPVYARVTSEYGNKKKKKKKSKHNSSVGYYGDIRY